MSEKEFNLLDEPWIRVTKQDLKIEEVSLKQALLNAREYRDLAGEMPTQDVAVFRLLLACALTIFYRYDSDGREEAIDGDWDKQDITNRAIEYWRKGKLPEAATVNYLERYRERFWLFHPETPFYQVAGLEYGTDFDTKTLFGNLKESNNKATLHHFSMSEGQNLSRLSYAAATRWLVHLNGFCINIKNNKAAPGTKDPAGVGRLGRLGITYIDGENLFERIMLNLVPYGPSGDSWASPNPVWEKEVCREQSRRISPPDNLPELYTLQSRRVLLKKENTGTGRSSGYITGYRVLNGDFYSYENDFNEPMTIWRTEEDKKTGAVAYIPKRHSSQTQIWREFPTLFDRGQDRRVPGVVQWVYRLCDEIPELRERLITVKTAGMEYDGMAYSYVDSISDGITMSAYLLGSLGEDWIPRITDEVGNCEKVAGTGIKFFAVKIGQLFGESTAKGKKTTTLSKKLTGNFYSRIDRGFRDWLFSIQPETDSREEKLAEWRKAAYRCALDVVMEYVKSLKQNAYRTHDADGQTMSVPGIYNSYIRTIRSVYPDAVGTGMNVQREDDYEPEN